MSRNHKVNISNAPTLNYLLLTENKKLAKTSKTLRIVVFTLLTATLLMAVANNYAPIAKAQTNDTVTLIASVGGSYANTDGSVQTPGPYTYADGSSQTFTAVPGDGFSFGLWTIVTAAYSYTDAVDNPLTITLNESAYAIQATFTPDTIIPPAVQTNSATNAIVVVIAGVGGTTSPAPGTYELANATSLDLTAIPNNGWQFDNWVIGGTPMNDHGSYSYTATPTNNPYNVDHGYGNTYSYEAVFSPVGTSTSPTVNEFSSAAAIFTAMALVIVAFGTYAYTRKAKK